MDAQTLGALASIVNEAIAKAVGPLQDRIKELECRPAQIKTVSTEEIENLIRERVGITDQVGTVYDHFKRLSAAITQPYDDSALRKELKSLQEHKPADGKDGKDGAPGIDGRDALQLEVLPAIDEAKSYQRGTYAKHAGGLWRSFEQTHGMRGWECIVDGVKSLQVVANGKEFTVIAERSSGEVTETKALIPVQVYKGVFTDAEYQQGDTATWAGSLWHCNVTGTKAKPGDGSGDWTLAVKKGRDGKDTVTVKTAEPVQIGGRNG